MGLPPPPSAPAPHVYLTAAPCSPPDPTRTRTPRLSRLPRLSRHAGLAPPRQRAARENAVKLTHPGLPLYPSARAPHVYLTPNPSSRPDQTRSTHPRLSRPPRLSRHADPASLGQRAARRNAVKLTHLGLTRLPSARAAHVYLTAAPCFPPGQTRTRPPRLCPLPWLSRDAGLASLRQRTAPPNSVKLTYMGRPRPPSAPVPHVYLTAAPCSPPGQTGTTRSPISRLPRLFRHAGPASLRQRAARQNAVKLTHMGRTRLPSARAPHVYLTASPFSQQDRTRTRPSRLSRFPRLSREAGLASLRQRAARQNAVKLTHMGRPHPPSARAPHVYLTASPFSPQGRTRTRHSRNSRLPRLSRHSGLASLSQRAARQNVVKLTHLGRPHLPRARAPHVYLTAAPCFPPDQTRTRPSRLSRFPRLSRDAGLASLRQRAARHKPS